MEDIDKIPLANQVNKATDTTANAAGKAGKTAEKVAEGEDLKPDKTPSNDATVQQAHELADDVSQLHKELKGLVKELGGASSMPMSSPSSSNADPTSELQAVDMTGLPTEKEGTGAGKQMGAQIGEQAGQAVGASVGGPAGAAVGGKIGKKVGAQVGQKLDEEMQEEEDKHMKGPKHS